MHLWIYSGMVVIVGRSENTAARENLRGPVYYRDCTSDAVDDAARR